MKPASAIASMNSSGVASPRVEVVGELLGFEAREVAGGGEFSAQYHRRCRFPMAHGRVHPIRCINRRVLGCLARLPWDSSHAMCQTVMD